MDVISILEKKRQQVTAFEVKTQGQRAADHPRIFTDIEIEYIVTGHNIDSAAVQRAVELSESKYCSAQAMLSKAARITNKITILEA
jgi:putative redox protein